MDPRSGRGSVAARSATGAARTTPVEIRVLGPLEVQVGEQQRPLPGRQERAVLTLLAVHVGEPVSVSRLFSLLWADDPPRTADKSLQTYVSRIRRVLGDDASIVRRESAYALALPRAAVDAARFADEVAAAREADRSGDSTAALDGFRRALALWRGAAPADTADSPEGTAIREYLADARINAVADLVRLEMRVGRAELAAAELEDLVVRNPLREDLWALLMEALALSGRPAAALAAYQRARERLVEELGLDPSPRLQELHRRILAEDADLSGTPAAGRGLPSRYGYATVPAAGPRRIPAPTDASALVGRDEDRVLVRSGLASSRLVTVVGTGGVGKTSLALDVAGAWAEPSALCELASVSDPAAVGHALAAALGIEPGLGEGPLDALASRLGADPFLLVIDNCEHVLSQVRLGVHELLGRCPQLRVLATSRQPLGVAAESVVTLAPLSVGIPGADADRMFVDRAARVGVTLPDDDRSRDLVAQICRSLDGLPLAIELAAAMTRVLALDDIERHVDNRLHLLAEPRLLGGRERSLADTVAWSYDLLEPAARAVFRRASVFHGGFDVDAAGSICRGADVAERDVPRLLAGLAERSMLERQDTGGLTRYRMLETMREFGEQALAPGELAATRQAHARWAVALARELDTEQFSEDEPAVVERFERELDNLRAAMRWSLAEGDADVALGLVSALHLLASWCVRSEVYGWVQETVDRFGDSGHPLASEALGALAAWRGLSGDRDSVEALVKRLRAREDRGQPLGPSAMEALIWFASRSGDFETAERCLDRLRQLDPAGFRTGEARGDTAAMRFYMGDVEGARRETAVMIAAAEGSSVPSMQAWAEVGRAIVMLSDQPDAGLPGLRRAITLARTCRRRLIERVAMSAVAALAARAHDPANALPAFGDILGAWQRDGVWRMEWGTLQSFMELTARLEMHEELLVLHSAGVTSPTAPPLYGDQAARLADAVERAEHVTGAEAAERARERGRAMSDTEVVAYARSLVS